MAGFRFRLESVLRVRGHELEQRRGALIQARGEASALDSRAQAAEEQASRAEAQARRSLASGVRAGDLLSCVDGTRRARDLAAALRRAAQRVRERAEEIGAEVDAARRRVKTLERLRERALRGHRAEAERRAQQRLDEVATNTWTRQGGGA